jgi:hypothetical protein
MAERGLAPLNEDDAGGSALDALAEKPPVDLNDVNLRKEVFNRAVQRILDARNAIQTPITQSPLSAFGSGMLGEGSIAQAFGRGMDMQTQAQAAQQAAEQQALGQRQGLDLRADMARILAGGGSPADAAQLAAIGGDDKAADNLSKLMLYSQRGTGRGTEFERLQDEREDPNITPERLRLIDKRLATIARGGKDAYDTKIDQENAELVSQGRKDAEEAQGILQSNKTLRQMLKKAGPTGPWVDILPDTVVAAVTDATTGDRQAARSKATASVLEQAKLLKGSVSNYEDQLIQKSAVGLGMDEDAWDAVLTAQDASALRKRERGKFREAYARQTGGDLTGELDAWDRFVADTTVINEDNSVNDVNLKKLMSGNAWMDYLPSGESEPAARGSDTAPNNGGEPNYSHLWGGKK